MSSIIFLNIGMMNSEQFTEALQPLENIWNHKLPNHHKKAKEEYISLATEMKSTGKNKVVVEC